MKKIFLLLVLCSASSLFSQQNLPILDMHLHALPASNNGPPPTAICAPMPEMPVHDPSRPWMETFIKWLKNPKCKKPIWGGKTDEEVMNKTIDILKKRNIYGVTSGILVDAYKKKEGDRIIPSLFFNAAQKDITPEKIKELLSSGKFKVFGEITNQYYGIAPSDPKFEPYVKIAEDLDIPIAIHMGPGPPGTPYIPGLSKYRAHLSSPLLLEPILNKHPKLRIYIMHAGYPFIDDLLALMVTYPQVYIDLGIICYAYPKAAFHSYLKKIVDAGFANRIMFGSDQMNWPETIEVGIEAINTANFLSEKQKRDILYNNAARFLRLTKEEIAKHHGN